MNPEKLTHTISTLNNYATECFGLDILNNSISAFTINQNIIASCAYNTYIEVLSNKSDSIYGYIKNCDFSQFTFSYLTFIGKTSYKINLKKKKVVLAFDYTKETFWGEVQGLDIHGTKKSEKGTGAFKFLTCSQVSGKIHAKIPLISIPVKLGHIKSQAISYCISVIKKFVGEIELILFDREFYVKDLMMTLNHLELPYLIFVPKKKGEITETLENMFVGETQTKTYVFDVNKNATTYTDEASMIFLKAIFDQKSYTHYDWCFVTNVENFDIDKMISTYKCRWRIETGFRIQDEAGCKSKSKEMIIRYFFFLYEQLLQSIWYVYYKKEEEVSFKQFIITLHNFMDEKQRLESSKVHIVRD